MVEPVSLSVLPLSDALVVVASACVSLADVSSWLPLVSPLLVGGLTVGVLGTAAGWQTWERDRTERACETEGIEIEQLWNEERKQAIADTMAHAELTTRSPRRPPQSPQKRGLLATIIVVSSTDSEQFARVDRTARVRTTGP